MYSIFFSFSSHCKPLTQQPFDCDMFPQASAFVARLGCKAACMTAGVTPAAVDGMSAALGINLLAGQQVIRRGGAGAAIVIMLAAPAECRADIVRRSQHYMYLLSV